MTWLYWLGISCYHLGVRAAALLGNEQARKWVRGRQQPFSPSPELAHGQQPLVWMHCASLGEWEQGRPVLEAIRAAHPEWRAVLTFFSPSGYERCHDTTAADYVSYLPADGPQSATAWIRQLQPTLAIFVKYEFWFFHLRALQRQGIPTFLVAASFRPEQLFFAPHGGWWRNMLGYFTGIITQTAADAALLVRRGGYPEERISVAGDPRMDRTLEVAAASFTDERIAAFTAPAEIVVVAGSVWPEDLQVLRTAWKKLPSSVRLILAPHQLHEQEVARTQVQWQARRYTQSSPGELRDERVLLLDTIGMLSRVYRYGDIAYVGGGFKTGLHNTREPMAYGLPTIFGPNHRKFPEAAAAIAAGGASSIGNGQELGQLLAELLETQRRQSAALAQKNLAATHAGAGKRTAEQLLRWFNAISLTLLLFALPGTCALAQNENFPPEQTALSTTQRLQNSVKNVFAKGNLLVAISGVEWRQGLALAGAIVPTGSTISLDLSLETNVNYAILASAEDEFYDLDLYLRGPDGEVIAVDSADDGTPILEFSVPATGSYQLQVHAVSGATPRTFFSVSILRGGGHSILEGDFRKISRTFFSATADLQARKSAGWQMQERQWCLFGFQLAENRGVTLCGLRPGSGKHAFVVSGHPDIRNIDLYLANRNQRIVAWATNTGSTPLVECSSTANDVFDLRVEMGKSQRPQLLFLGVIAF